MKCAIRLVVLVVLLVAPASAQTALTAERVASGLNAPVFVCSEPGNPDRLYVPEQNTGLIKIIDNGSLLSEPFLDLGGQIVAGGFEQGLLGMAFHPAFLEGERYVFVNYTGTDGDTFVDRYDVSSDALTADPASRVEFLRVPQPYSNHNAGMLAFSPVDGYLYVGMGDGGGSNDPDNNGQDLSTALGSMLRINVDAPSNGKPYSVPADNPFVNEPNADARIWAYGLRNPWRYSFDSETGDLYIGDVGQGAIEEIDFQPASSDGGENYGWDIAEGTACLGGTGDCGTQAGLVPPIYEYPHTEGRSVTGGYVYRGARFPEYRGTYFFGDYTESRVWSFRYQNGSVMDFTERTSELAPSEGSIVNISSFGVDSAGELYICSLGTGEIFKIVPANPTDTDGDGLLDSSEQFFGSNINEADTDSDGLDDAAEVIEWGADPTLADTDGDGVSDGDEVAAGTDPTDPADNGVLPTASYLGLAGLLLALGTAGGRALGKGPVVKRLS
jgi:glucose/arabinose dehydrogenase